jgi:hypothetical protein
MTSDGTVPAGRVDDSLLTRDRRVPFGLRLDAAAVEQAFTDVWHPRSVVLVEGSDLVRADLSSRFASEAAGQHMRDAALRRTDALVGRLLDHVDLERDLVVVVGASPRLDDDSLTVAAVSGPSFAPGLLRSTTTQRDGFVNITDVAPTVLHAFGLERPDAMEGRRIESAAGDASLADRAATLADANTDGLFRDGLVGWVMGPVIGVAFGLGLLVVLVDRFARLAFLRGIVVFAALWLLGFLDAVYLAAPFHFARHGGEGAYWAFAVGVATILTVGFLLLGCRKPIDAMLVGLGSVLVLHLADLVTGAHLEWITVFGYSPTIGVRFVGEGNMTFALLSASVTLFAGLFAWRFPTVLGRRVAIGLLVVTVVVIGAPFWGNDFGGAVSAAPGFALLGWLLLGHKLRWRTVGGLALVLVASGILVGLVDLLRPPESRTHVGKFFEKAGTDFGAATLVLRRKLAENLAVLTHSLLAICLLVAAGLVLYLWFARPRTLRTVERRVDTARATGFALAVVAVLGFALNDSGIAIPGMMAAVFVSTLSFVVARGLGAPLAGDASPSDDPSEPPTTAEEPVPVRAGRS